MLSNLETSCQNSCNYDYLKSVGGGIWIWKQWIEGSLRKGYGRSDKEKKIMAVKLIEDLLMRLKKMSAY